MNRATEIEEQAAEWLIRLDRQPTESARAEFETWVSVDLRHRAAYLRLSAAWTKTARMKTLARTDVPIDPDLLKAPRERVGWSRYLWAVAAAAVVVSVGSFVLWTLRPAIDVYRTDVGGYSRVPLADGSFVSLNTDSEVRVRLDPQVREITLVRGEALFDVAHDTRRPFDVHAGSTVVRAVGTSFDVRRRSADEVDVVVTDGKVAVNSGNTPGSTRATAAPTLVVAGEVAAALPKGVEVRKVDRKDVTRRLSWQAGELSFQGESLAEVIGEFNRYSQRHLELADPSLQNLEVGGSFRATDIDSFVVALHASFGLIADAGDDGTLRIRREATIPGPAPASVVTRQ
jgi:transmembrane sensor